MRFAVILCQITFPCVPISTLSVLICFYHYFVRQMKHHITEARRYIFLIKVYNRGLLLQL